MFLTSDNEISVVESPMNKAEFIILLSISKTKILTLSFDGSRFLYFPSIDKAILL